jgi:hypothetical protein
MDIDSLLEACTGFFRDQTLWALLISLVIGALIYWKPKDMFKLVLAGLTLGAIIYVFSFLIDLTSRGIDDSKKFSNTPKIEAE